MYGYLSCTNIGLGAQHSHLPPLLPPPPIYHIQHIDITTRDQPIIASLPAPINQFIVTLPCPRTNASMELV
jgi:hypothetical protein